MWIYLLTAIRFSSFLHPFMAIPAGHMIICHFFFFCPLLRWPPFRTQTRRLRLGCLRFPGCRFLISRRRQTKRPFNPDSRLCAVCIVKTKNPPPAQYLRLAFSPLRLAAFPPPAHSPVGGVGTRPAERREEEDDAEQFCRYSWKRDKGRSQTGASEAKRRLCFAFFSFTLSFPGHTGELSRRSRCPSPPCYSVATEHL